MADSERTEDSIKMLRILPHVADIEPAWVVEIEYTDGYVCSYKIDDKGDSQDMLEEVMKTVRRQVREGKHG